MAAGGRLAVCAAIGHVPGCAWQQTPPVCCLERMASTLIDEALDRLPSSGASDGGPPRPRSGARRCCGRSSPASCWRSSRAGRSSCTCRAGSPRTSATRCAPPGRSRGSGTRCCTTRCTCSTPTPSTPTRSASPSRTRCSATARRRSSARGTVAALVRYNLLFLWAWSLCFVGAYLLARELGLRWLGAAAAGVAFAYAPYRVTEAGHLHVISSGGLALALFLLLRGYRRGSRGLVLAGWLVSAWQVSLGFTLGLQYTYLLARARAARARRTGGAGA